MKKCKYRTRTIVGGNNTKHEGYSGTPASHLETAKMLFNSVLTRKNVKFTTIDIANFYLVAPVEQCECLRMSIKTIPEEIVKEYEFKKKQNAVDRCVLKLARVFVVQPK